MTKFEKEENIEFNNKKYSIVKFKYKKKKLPIIFDYKIYKVIKKINRNWYCNDKGFIYTRDEDGADIFIHDVIKKIESKLNNIKYVHRPILHINRITFDNRLENLQYDSTIKDYNKNMKKKKRTINLPSNSGINVKKLPTFIWYLKEDNSHGERFFISVDDIKWKTTSSNKVSLKYKLEEAKKFLRNLKNTRMDIFEKYSMNGDFNKKGNELLKDYLTIAKNMGYKNNIIQIDYNTNKVLKEDLSGLNSFEKQMLNQLNPQKGGSNINSLYKKYKKKYINNLPKYCYYKELSSGKNDYFYIKSHPNCTKWKNIENNKDISYKYNELLNKLNELNN